MNASVPNKIICGIIINITESRAFSTGWKTLNLNIGMPGGWDYGQKARSVKQREGQTEECLKCHGKNNDRILRYMVIE